MITIKKINSKKGMLDFVKFPFSLYKNSKTWVPPLISEELTTFDPEKNPAFENCEATFYLAYNDEHIVVGRIAVIINHYEINRGVRKVRFGWLDMIDNIEVTDALLKKALDKAYELGLDYVEGPMGFSNMDKVGIQTFGFEHIGSMITWTNYPYYAKHLEKLGWKKEKSYVESFFYLKDVDFEPYKKAGDVVERRYGLSYAPIKTNKDIIPYVDEMFDLFNTSYANLSTFIPVSEKQKEYFKEKYIPFVLPEFIKFILNKEGKIICFAIMIPSFSKALQKARGKFFPFGFYHLWKARRNPKILEFYLIGISPEYQSKGVPAMLFRDCYLLFKEKGVEQFIITPELEDNIVVQRLWKNFNPTTFSRRSTYKKAIVKGKK
ncbi:GTP cyclohydrolase [Capnocytophaga sp. G2]|uniref:GTP cyclohydrolase n=1 Tax=Capnocytophaga sp. G2 TaxID=3110695 RepID=UPI002B47C2B9|nr:GTP cyclohydrolase [Capnocytophaga sp. G2]MEB3004795.1 GTP cyclohydrolase [Capnocytophaga sp. G2]